MSKPVVDSLRAQFLPQFLTTSRGRLERGQTLLGGDDPKAVARLVVEFHEMAGEASLLGFSEVAQLALEGERLAQLLRDGAPDGRASSCREILDGIQRVLKDLEVNPTEGAGE